MDAKYINKNYLEESIKNYDATIVDPIRSVVSNIYYNAADSYNDLLNVINASVSGGIGLDLQLNYINSTSPVNYQNVEHVAFATGQIGNLWCDTPDKAGTQYYDWNATTNTLTFSSLTGIVTFNSNMSNTFYGCANLNQNILIPDGVTDMAKTFYNCYNLNQNILISNSVTNMYQTFLYCYNLNQNILIPNNVTNLTGTFGACYNLNQNILIPNSVTRLASTFQICNNLNQNILIPNSVTVMLQAFAQCSNLNQNILIPDGVADMTKTFKGCTSLNQNILIPSNVSALYNTFEGCTSLNQNIYLYTDLITVVKGQTTFDNAFNGCTLLSDKYIHIRSSIPLDTSNNIYNCLVNGKTGVNWTGRVINDLEEPTQWPPV